MDPFTIDPDWLAGIAKLPTEDVVRAYLHARTMLDDAQDKCRRANQAIQQLGPLARDKMQRDVGNRTVVVDGFAVRCHADRKGIDVRPVQAIPPEAPKGAGR